MKNIGSCIFFLFFFTLTPYTSCGENTALIEEHPLVIIIPAHNACTNYLKNIVSVFMQKYAHYRLIYIDDGSTDGTAESVASFLKKQYATASYTLKQHALHRGPLAVLYDAIHSCADDEIVVLLRDNDFFATDEALKKINKAYSKEDVWLTFGQCFLYPDNVILQQKAPSESIARLQCYRELYDNLWHPCTFYAGLFKQIPLQSLMDNSIFYPESWLSCIMFALLEMASSHFSYQSEYLYAFNFHDHQKNTETEYRAKQCEKKIRSAHHLAPVPSIHKNIHQHPTSDAIIFSNKNLEYFLTSSSINLTFFNAIYVFETSEHNATSDIIKKRFPVINYVYCSPSDNIAHLISTIMQESKADYVLFASDARIISSPETLQRAEQALEQTNAYAFYFDKTIGKHIPTNHALLDSDIIAWQYKNTRLPPHTFNNALYRRETCRNIFKDLFSTSIQELLFLCNSEKFSLDQVGLCFNHPETAACAG